MVATTTPLLIYRAQTFVSRLGGLLTRAPLQANEALYLSPCSSVHTFFMSYSIDVVFLDHCARVLKTVESLRPWRAAYCHGAHAALELRGGQIALRHISVGAEIEGFQRTGASI